MSLIAPTNFDATRAQVLKHPIARSAFDRALFERYRDPPPVPDTVLAVAFRRPWGAMVVDGVKPIDTRERPFERPGGPQWIAVYNCQRVDELQANARILPGALPYQYGGGPDDDRLVEGRQGPPQTVLGMVFVMGSRLLERADLPLSFFYERGRFAWILAHPVRFREPVSAEALGLKKGPQSPVRVPGAPLRAAMGVTSKGSI